MSLKQIQNLRNRYKPKYIKYLLIAESPPLSKNTSVRFFYNPLQEKYDFMFKSIMEVIFPDFKTQYKKGTKYMYLEKFKNEGFYLIDTVDIPINHLRNEKDKNEKIYSNLKKKIAEIKKLVSKKTPIFIIKKNIFLIFKDLLEKEGYNVVNNEFIPFPSFGNQLKFKKIFKKYLRRVRVSH